MPSRTVWAATDTGLVRNRNEDRYGLPGCISNGDRDHWQGALSTIDGWAVVADGLGGHAAGEVASLSVVRSVRNAAHGLGSESGIAEALRFANQQLFDEVSAGFGRSGMGSTIVGISFADGACFGFNVGDSRLYIRRGGYLRQVSTDDTTTMHARSWGHRSHTLSQSLGGTSLPMPISPHVSPLDLAADDVVLLCSDGLSDMLTESEILTVLDSGPVHPAVALVEAAVQAGGRDNVTVIVIGHVAASVEVQR